MPKCKNCQTELVGEFCHSCGQHTKFDSLSPKLLLSHTVDQLFSIDSKFLTTLRRAVLHPAILAIDYINGKHKSQINPITLYLVTLGIFALVMSYFPIDIAPIIDQMNSYNQSQTGATVSEEMRQMQIRFSKLMFENIRLVNFVIYISLPFLLRLLFSAKKFHRTLTHNFVFVLYLASTLNLLSIAIVFLRVASGNDSLAYLGLPIGLIYFVIVGLKFYADRLSVALRLAIAFVGMYCCMVFFSFLTTILYLMLTR